MSNQEGEIAKAFEGARRVEFGGIADTDMLLGEFFETHEVDYDFTLVAVDKDSSYRPDNVVHVDFAPQSVAAGERANVDFHRELYLVWLKAGGDDRSREMAYHHFGEMHRYMGLAATRELRKAS